MADDEIIAPTPITKTSRFGERTVDVPRAPMDKPYEQPPNPQSRLRKERADFKPDKFRKVIEQHGKIMTWRKALWCPCHNETTGQSDLNCIDCGAAGFVYVDPIEIRGHMTMMDADVSEYNHPGRYLKGARASITTFPENRLTYWDSLELIDAIMSYAEILKKGDRRGRRANLPVGEDVGRYKVLNVTRLAIKDANGRVMLLEEPTHFSVTENGRIRWTSAGDALIANDGFFSILYEFHPVYFVQNHPHAWRDDFVITKRPQQTYTALPIQADLALSFLVASEEGNVTGEC